MCVRERERERERDPGHTGQSEILVDVGRCWGLNNKLTQPKIKQEKGWGRGGIRMKTGNQLHIYHFLIAHTPHHNP